jgi:hypothetical protein
LSIVASGAGTREQAHPLAAERERSVRGGAREPDQPSQGVERTIPAVGRRLLWLQRAAGNRAVTREVRRLREESTFDGARTVHRSPAPPQPHPHRTYLDQKKKQESVQKEVEAARGDVGEIDNVLKAVLAYEKAPSVSTAQTLGTLLATLIWSVLSAKSVVTSDAVKGILDDLHKEASTAHADVIKADAHMRALGDEKFVRNSDSIAKARREVRAMLSRYGTKTGHSTQEALYFFIDRVNVALSKAESNRIEKIGQLEYNYGDPKTGKIDKETRGYLDAFGAITAFLADKPTVLKHLQPLAKPVNDVPAKKDATEKLDTLKRELRRKETEAGFAAPKVPLGFLPPEVFVALLRDGTVLDDFGAGLQHGELSHRIQWYAIIDYMQNEGKTVKKLKRYTALDLFQRINAEGFSPDRQGNTMWGTVLDAGTSASADSYSAPGTLNRDLLEASEGFKAEGVGLAERDPTYEAPDTGGLESIGDALVELRTLRMQQAQELGVALKGDLWTKYGVPPPELAAKIEKNMSDSGQYKVSDEGVSDEGKKWKVLEEVIPETPPKG